MNFLKFMKIRNDKKEKLISIPIEAHQIFKNSNDVAVFIEDGNLILKPVQK